MVGVRIMAPAHEERSGVDRFETRQNLRNGLFRTRTFAWNKPIWKPQKSDIARIEAEFARRLQSLCLPQVSQFLFRMRFAVRMRARPIADDDNSCWASQLASVRDQAATSQTFVIRVRSDDDETSIAQALLQRGDRKGTGRLQ